MIMSIQSHCPVEGKGLDGKRQCGEEWKRPKDLHDMMMFPEGKEEQVRPYVANYPMNLIQVAKLTEEELGMMKELTNNREYRTICRILNEEEKKKGGLNMLDIAKIYKNEGIAQGVAQGFVQAVEAVIQYDLRNQVPGDQIIEKLIRCFSITPEKAAEYFDRCVRKDE